MDWDAIEAAMAVGNKRMAKSALRRAVAGSTREARLYITRGRLWSVITDRGAYFSVYGQAPVEVGAGGIASWPARHIAIYRTAG